MLGEGLSRKIWSSFNHKYSILNTQKRHRTQNISGRPQVVLNPSAPWFSLHLPNMPRPCRWSNFRCAEIGRRCPLQCSSLHAAVVCVVFLWPWVLRLLWLQLLTRPNLVTELMAVTKAGLHWVSAHLHVRTCIVQVDTLRAWNRRTFPGPAPTVHWAMVGHSGHSKMAEMDPEMYHLHVQIYNVHENKLLFWSQHRSLQQLLFHAKICIGHLGDKLHVWSLHTFRPPAVAREPPAPADLMDLMGPPRWKVLSADLGTQWTPLTLDHWWNFDLAAAATRRSLGTFVTHNWYIRIMTSIVSQSPYLKILDLSIGNSAAVTLTQMGTSVEKVSGQATCADLLPLGPPGSEDMEIKWTRRSTSSTIIASEIPMILSISMDKLWFESCFSGATSQHFRAKSWENHRNITIFRWQNHQNLWKNPGETW